MLPETDQGVRAVILYVSVRMRQLVLSLRCLQLKNVLALVLGVCIQAIEKRCPCLASFCLYTECVLMFVYVSYTRMPPPLPPFVRYLCLRVMSFELHVYRR